MSFNVLSLQNYDLSNPAQAKQYQYQLMQYLNGLQQQINQFQTALTSSAKDLGALSSNTTFNAASALVVSIKFTFSAAITLTIQNLALGTVMMMNITNSSAGSLILTGAATTPSGAAYTSWLVNSATQQNLLTGWNFTTGQNRICVGTTTTGPAIYMVAN